MRYAKLKMSLNVWCSAGQSFAGGPLLCRVGDEIRKARKSPDGGWVFEVRRESPVTAQRVPWTEVRTSRTCDLNEFVEGGVRVRGQPQKGATPMTENITLRLRKDQLAHLLEWSAAHNMSVLDYVRRTLETGGMPK